MSEKNAPKIEEPQAVEPEEAFDADSFGKELDAGVEAAVKEAEENAEPAKKDEVVEEEDDPEKKDEVVEEEEGDPEKKDEVVEETEEEKAARLEAEKAEAEKAKVPVAIDDVTLERAVHAGLSIAAAKAFPNAGALNEALTIIESNKPDKNDEDPDEEEDPLKDIPSLDPDDYDEKIIAVFEGLKGVIKTQQESIKSMRDTRASADTSDAEAKGTQWFDSQINSLGDDYSDVLGAGTIKDLKPESKEFQVRAALARKVESLNAGYAATGEDVTPEQVFKEAVALQFPDKRSSIQRKKAAGEAEDRESQLVSRAGRKKHTVKTTLEKEVGDEIDKRFGTSD